MHAAKINKLFIDAEFDLKTGASANLKPSPDGRENPFAAFLSAKDLEGQREFATKIK
ncbi:hypothetical protein KIH23_11360 [Flavobacterium sp. CYK-55]|uniref:hypothetical protein n=1 Tax=Flavobacterium sp. CYK-55 TaxID=2835529 RepID=UPI001BCB3065|nr:hypothetical protein [Flavobacterium sp. CYK-55]MBS7787894.1 hypothetical protein [Flavobacterium sp. CYK-55]